VRITNVQEDDRHDWIGFIGFRLPYASFPVFADYSYDFDFGDRRFYCVSDISVI
jgi:hypothetical protein